MDDIVVTPATISKVAVEESLILKVIAELPAPVKATSGCPDNPLLGVITMFLFALDIRFQTSLWLH
jgi:hypothetical protein